MPKSRRIGVDYISTPLADVPTVEALEDVVDSINRLKEELDSIKGNSGGLSAEIIDSVKQSIDVLAQRISTLESEEKESSEKLDSISGVLAAVILLAQRTSRKEESAFQIVIKKPEELVFTFDHLGNYSDVKTQLENYTSLLRRIPDLKSRGVKLNGKLLICGRPGTGKTTLVYALAKESQIPIIDFQKSLASVPQNNTIQGIHSIFKYVRESSDNKPLILFIDNFDVLAQSRDLSQSSTLSSMLDELDATNLCDHSVLIIAATSRPDLLDMAVWTRFDDVIYVPLPDTQMRTEILHVLLSRLSYEKNVDFPQISEATENFTGADLENLIFRALVALEMGRKKEKVLTTDVLLAIAHSMRTEIIQRVKEKIKLKKDLREETLQQYLVQDIVTNDRQYEKVLTVLTKLKGGDSLSSDEVNIAKNFEFLTSNPVKSIEVLREKREKVLKVRETMQKMWGGKLDSRSKTE